MATSEYFTQATTSEEVAKQFSSEMQGKVVLITGCTYGGIGAETARIIVQNGAKLVVVAGRVQEKLDVTIANIKSEAPEANLRPLVLDLSSLDAVTKAAAEVNKYSENIDVLINNAAVMANPFSKTVDGIESQFATNHIGHFLFTNLILEKILASPNPRVVVVSSTAMRCAPVFFDDYNFSDGAKYDPWHAYGQSKSANGLFAKQLAKKHQAKGLVALFLHPGAIGTNLQRHQSFDAMMANPPRDYRDRPLVEDIQKIFWKSLSQGASTTLVAAFDPSKAAYSGSYLEDCQLKDGNCPEWINMENAEKLWKLSEELVNQKF
jgi:NAD(P)-dependent dehydrogenase (short-subunit alcohol dehydrogenase family)